MENDLFHRKFDFTDDLDRLLKELEADAKEPPSQTFEEFLRDCENRETANRLYVPDKSQFVKAATVYRHVYSFAKELFSDFDLTVGADGMFTIAVHIEHPLMLSCHDPIAEDLIQSIQNADQFCISPAKQQSFTLSFGLRLYQVTLLAP